MHVLAVGHREREQRDIQRRGVEPEQKDAVPEELNSMPVLFSLSFFFPLFSRREYQREVSVEESQGRDVA